MAETMPIVFVVRASVRDGLGHLVRSLCVLRELVQHTPAARLLLLGDRSGTHLLEDAGVSWQFCQSDTVAMEALLHLAPQRVVFDTLHFDGDAFALLPAEVVTVSLSPVFTQMQSVRHLFHRTINEDPSWDRSGTFPKVHKGLRYAVLPAWLKRVSTTHYREQVQEERLAVAISMGGTDAPNRTLALLKLLGQCPKRLVIFVALGDAYTHSYEELIACASESRQEIILLKSNESMWRVLRSVSLVICAGGLTTYEAAFIGIPAFNILQHKSWAWLFEELSSRNACVTIAPDGESLTHATEAVMALERDRERLVSMHLATKGLIAAGGARRIADSLLRLR